MPDQTWTQTTELPAFLEKWLSPKRVSAIAWSVAIVLGAIRTYAARHFMNHDGMSYLDIASAYLSGDWHAGLNSYWSPLYSWLIGIVLLVFRPSPYWEFTAAHILNLLTYLALLASFGLFWKELFPGRRSAQETEGESAPSFPEGAWMLIGYALAIWSALHLIGVATVGPDLLLAVLVNLTAYLLVRIRCGSLNWSHFSFLGVILGLAFLAKAAMLPFVLLCFVVAGLAVGNLRRAAARMLAVLFFFLLVSAPFVTVLSISKGRLTIGDSAKVNYAYSMYRLPKDVSPSDLDEASIPSVYPESAPGTFPPWYDPIYFIGEPGDRASGTDEQAVPPLSKYFDLKKQIQNLMTSGLAYYDLFFLRQGHLVAGVLVLFLVGADWRSQLRSILRNWHLLLPTLAAFGMYGVVFVDDRYVGPFVPLLWGAVLAGIRLPDSEAGRRLATGVSVAVAVLFFVQLLGLVGRDLGREAQSTGHVHWAVADGLQKLGLRPGDKVGVVGSGISSYWARLGGFRIAAEIPPEDTERFLDASRGMRRRSMETFARAGVRVIVARRIPSFAKEEGWVPIGNTGRYAYFFRDSNVNPVGPVP